MLHIAILFPILVISLKGLIIVLGLSLWFNTGNSDEEISTWKSASGITMVRRPFTSIHGGCPTKNELPQ